jgi:hypothetical protein
MMEMNVGWEERLKALNCIFLADFRKLRVRSKKTKLSSNDESDVIDVIVADVDNDEGDVVVDSDFSISDVDEEEKIIAEDDKVYRFNFNNKIVKCLCKLC